MGKELVRLNFQSKFQNDSRTAKGNSDDYSGVEPRDVE